MKISTPTTEARTIEAPSSSTPETLAEIHDFYVAQVNNLVAEDREWMIPSLTDEYDRIVERVERTARAA